MKNDVIKTLTYPSVYLNELIEVQANQQTGTIPSQDNCSSMTNGKGNETRGKVYQKFRPNSVKRHK